MPLIDPFARIRDRKESYIEHTTDLDWISSNMLRWEFRLPKIELSIDFNVLFNFLLDFYLAVDLHFPWESFDFPSFDFDWGSELGIELPPLPWEVIDWQKIPKAQYGITRYNESLYDPPEVTHTDLSRFLWNMRYHSTEKSVPYYKSISQALKNYFDTHKNILEAKGVRREYLEAMFETLMKVEGKVLNASYVGFSFVGLNKVMKSIERRRYRAGIGKMRSTVDYKMELTFYTLMPYESYVGNSRVGYARVICTDKEFMRKYLCPLSKTLEWLVKYFKMRSSKTPIARGLDVTVRPEVKEITKNITPPAHTLYQRTFFLQKRRNFEWEGGKHQARLQHIIERVKQILNKYGVQGSFRLNYIAFAKEYVYMNYKPHRRHKQWKVLLTEDDLVEKYKRMGCDETVLREIITSVKTFKTVVDTETYQKDQLA